MNSATQNMFLAAALVTLAASGFAQQTGIAPDPKSPTTQQTVRERKPNHAPIALAGEAANLERTETGSIEEQNTLDDNRDLQTAADRAQPQRPQNCAPSAVDRGQHQAKAANTKPQGEAGKGARKPQEHAAALKTGAWTSGEATLLQAKETSLTQEVVSAREENGDDLQTVKHPQIKQKPKPAPQPRKQQPTIPPQ